MTSMLLNFLLILAMVTATPSAAASGADNPESSQSAWSRFWHGVADDWKKIGKDAKESGAEAGRAVKDEVQKMPENFRKGFEEAKADFNNGTGSPPEPRTDN